LASAGDDRAIKLWNWQKAECVCTIGVIMKVIYLKYEKHILMCGVSDGTAIKLNLSTVPEHKSSSPLECGFHSLQIDAPKTEESEIKLQTVVLSVIEKGSSQFNGGQVGSAAVTYQEGLDAVILLMEQQEQVALQSAQKYAYSAILGGLKECKGKLKGMLDADKCWKLKTLLYEVVATDEGYEEKSEDGGKPLAMYCILDRNQYFCGRVDGGIDLFDWKSRESLKSFLGHRSWIRCIIFDASQNVMYTSSDDKLIRIWDTETGICLRILEGHGDEVNWMVVQKNYLASCGRDGRVFVWKFEK